MSADYAYNSTYPQAAVPLDENTFARVLVSATNGKITQGSTAGSKVSDTVNADIFNCAGDSNDFAGRYGSVADVNAWLNGLKVAPVSFSAATNAFVSIEYLGMDKLDQNGVNFKNNEGAKAADTTCAANLALSWTEFVATTPC